MYNVSGNSLRAVDTVFGFVRCVARLTVARNPSIRRTTYVMRKVRQTNEEGTEERHEEEISPLKFASKAGEREDVLRSVFSRYD